MILALIFMSVLVLFLNLGTIFYTVLAIFIRIIIYVSLIFVFKLFDKKEYALIKNLLKPK